MSLPTPSPLCVAATSHLGSVDACPLMLLIMPSGQGIPLVDVSQGHGVSGQGMVIWAHHKVTCKSQLVCDHTNWTQQIRLWLWL